MPTPSGYMHDDAYNCGDLLVGDTHTLHYEQYGNPTGKPVIFLHGGPGDCTTKADTVFFDPAAYRVVLIDQRGCGKSTPLAGITMNTTQHLVADIEHLRVYLGIGHWSMVFGGSWGSTLALTYAEAHPSKVRSLVLRGIFLGTREENEWDDKVATLFCPEVQEKFLAALTLEERREPQASYYNRLLSGDKDRQKAAAMAWNAREAEMSSQQLSVDSLVKLEDEKWGLAHARIEAHYFVHNCFLEDGQILRNAYKIRGIPTSIVHGRLDLLCPPQAAWRLHHALPGSDLHLIVGAGHGAREPGTLEKLIEICDGHAKRS